MFTALPHAAATAGACASLAAATYAALCAGIALRCTQGRRADPSPSHLHGVDLRRHEVRFAARDGRASVAAWQLPPSTQPGGAGAAAAVILVHGENGSRGAALSTPGLHLAFALRKAGFTVLALDLRGHGDSDPAPLACGQRERHDVLGAYDHLLRCGFRPGRIGVLGVSMGATAAVYAAADEPGIGAVVADSPWHDGRAALVRLAATRSGWRLPLPPGVSTWSRWLGGVDLRRAQPVEAARRLAGRPVLVVHARGDRQVPWSQAAAIAHAAAADLWLTEVDTHLGSYAVVPTIYTRRVLTFFLTHLLGASAPQRDTNERGAPTPAGGSRHARDPRHAAGRPVGDAAGPHVGDHGVEVDRAVDALLA